MDFTYKKRSNNKGEYLEIVDFKPDSFFIEIPAFIENIPITDISQTALVRNPHIAGFILHCEEDDFSMAKFILNNTSQSLRIIFKNPTKTFELAFPGYNDRAIEDTMARAIHFKIDGSGYAYRECVFRNNIDFVGYDKIFERGKEELGFIPIDIALSRLMYPFRLSEDSYNTYQKYLLNNKSKVIDYLIEKKDKDRLIFFFSNFKLSNEEKALALKKTSEKRLLDLTSIIMKYSL